MAGAGGLTRALLCPACGYDVTPTIDAGVDRCPECGGGVSAGACRAVEPPGAIGRSVVMYLGACAIAPLVTAAVVGLFGPAGLGEVFPPLSVVAVLIGYTGGTLCVLGWPTGAGWLTQKIVRAHDALRSMTVFALLAIAGGLCLLLGLGTGMWAVLALVGGK